MSQDSSRQVDLAHMRISYAETGIDRGDLAATWHEQFDRWLAEAVTAGLTEPNAMVVATADADGTPTSRTVLAKAVDAGGVTFFTNYESKKSADLTVNPRVSVTFPWYDLQRQVHLRGSVHRTGRDVTQQYWDTRWRGSQIGAWASPQSRQVADRAELDRWEAEAAARFGDDEPVPVPPQWGGWRIVPEYVEFWQGRRGRMHDRLVYRLDENGSWSVLRLAP